MLFALVYWLLRRLIGLAAGSLGSRHNDLEVLVLGHQLAVLRRQFSLWVPENRSWGLSCGFVEKAIGPRSSVHGPSTALSAVLPSHTVAGLLARSSAAKDAERSLSSLMRHVGREFAEAAPLGRWAC